MVRVDDEIADRLQKIGIEITVLAQKVRELVGSLESTGMGRRLVVVQEPLSVSENERGISIVSVSKESE